MAEGLSGCNGKDGYTDDLYKGGGRGHRIHRRRNGDGGKFPEFTACPAAEFAKRFGFTDIMPALCNVDYASMELLHAKLVRTTTCVDGCRCDYTICGDKDPYVKEHPEYRDENGYRRNK